MKMRTNMGKFKEKFFSENTAVGLLIISLALLIVFATSFSRCNRWSTEDLGSLTGGVVMCIISIANALLLYSTLILQSKSIINEKEAHRQQQFETTFFNLMEFQRKFSEQMEVKYNYVDDDGNISKNEAKGKDVFSFAIGEIKLISMALKSDVSAKYDKDVPMKEIIELENEKNILYPIELEGQRYEKMEGIKNTLRIKYCNRVYDIDDEARKRYSYDNKMSYMLFSKKWDIYFEQYLTNLYYIMQYVCDEYSMDEKEMQKYIHFVQLQMSRDELYLAEEHAQSFPSFRDLLDRTHLTDILTK